MEKTGLVVVTQYQIELSSPNSTKDKSKASSTYDVLLTSIVDSAQPTGMCTIPLALDQKIQIRPALKIYCRNNTNLLLFWKKHWHLFAYLS